MHIYALYMHLDFLKPKSNRCEHCEKYRLAETEGQLTKEITKTFEAHMKGPKWTK